MFVVHTCHPRRRYGFFQFLWDVFMTALTCGLWLIWIFCREMRKNRDPYGSCRCV